MIKPDGFILTLTGPSGSGKSTVEKKLTEHGFERVISTTTRLPRSGEKHGEHYYFLSGVEFDELVQSGEMVEHVEFGNFKYGVTRSELSRVFSTGSPVVMVLEPKGLAQVVSTADASNWHIHCVYITAPTKTLLTRMLGREQTPFNTHVMADRIIHLMEEELEWEFDCVQVDTRIYNINDMSVDEVVDEILGDWSIGLYEYRMSA